MNATIEDYRWLVGPEAAVYLEEKEQAVLDPLKALDSLRRDLPPQRAALVVEQRQLRRRAAKKFAAADQMFFTRLGLEQASGQVVAGYKAQRFAAAASVADLCCGIGGDLLSLAVPVGHVPAGRQVVGIDRDPIAVSLAQANVAVLGRGASVEAGDARQVDVSQFDLWHIDPDRRTLGRRTTTLDYFEPDLGALDELIGRNDNVAVKLAPATAAPDHWQAAAELEWISWQNECRQQVAWFGRLAECEGDECAGRRRATWLSADGSRHSSISGQADAPHEVAVRPASFVLDADPAVRAAHLTGALAAQFELAALGTTAAYLTGDQPIADGLLTCFEVLDCLPFDLRRLTRLLRTRQIGRLEVKKRAVPNEVYTAASGLRTKGDGAATLFLTRLEERITAILARRLNRELPPSGRA